MNYMPLCPNCGKVMYVTQLGQPYLCHNPGCYYFMKEQNIQTVVSTNTTGMEGK